MIFFPIFVEAVLKNRFRTASAIGNFKKTNMKEESFFALLTGVVAGLTLGLLFAPESGEETRRKVRKAAGEGWDKARDACGNASEEAKKAFSEAREKASDFYGRAKEETADALQEMKARGRLARMELKDLRDTLKEQAADMKEEARQKILEQLEKLEAALRRDGDGQEGNPDPEAS